MKNLRRKTSWLHLVVLLVLVGAAVHGLTWAGWLERPESIYVDLWHRLAGRRYVPQHVAKVIWEEFRDPALVWRVVCAELWMRNFF